MPACMPPRYRLLDLLFALVGTFAFLGDLGSDVWSTLKYYEAGHTLWAASHFGLFVLSSSVLQVLSWGWFWVDRSHWTVDEVAVPQLENIGINGTTNKEQKLPVCTGTETTARARSCSVDGNVSNSFPEDMTACHTVTEGTNVETACCPGTEVPTKDNIENGDNSPVILFPENHGSQKWMCCYPNDHHGDSNDYYEHFRRHFYTSRIVLWPSCLLITHIFQMGYLLRCIHSLEVGIAAYRTPKSSQYQDYAYFLTHDISMMRLVETFLENTPQLILVLYIIIHQETIYNFQYISISISFICISWAILDYHQSLRLFLKEKETLGTLSSIIYFLWNFCLISSRILCITLFTVLFQWWISIHFLSLWLAFFIWATLQKTDFMKNKILEFFYRVTVAIILYFSWFNIADGRTIYRCIIYYMFIITDSTLLILSWNCLKFPSILDEYEIHILAIVALFFIVGLLMRLLYYKHVHPNVFRKDKQYYDEPDSTEAYKMFVSTIKAGGQNNTRILYLAKQSC